VSQGNQTKKQGVALSKTNEYGIERPNPTKEKE
jgi:hypothetical protein